MLTLTPFLATLARACGLISIAVGVISAAEARPNIILIMADDFGYECVTANGGQSYQTPNLDKLAASGLRFEHCHVQPLCTPTRVQLMTGLYNVRNYLNFGTLPRTQTTFAHLLKRAGYSTGMPLPKHLDGRSLAPLLRDPKSAWDIPALTTHGLKNHTVRTEGWRYIRYANGDEELYDAAADPLEYTNLANRSEHTARKSEFARWLPKSDAANLPARGGGDAKKKAKTKQRP